MSGFALQYDGSQNYVSLGTMGNLGSNLGSGFYAKFQIKTTLSGSFASVLGAGNTSFDTSVFIQINTTNGSTVSNQKVRITLSDSTDTHAVEGFSTTAYNFNDGNIHTFEITITPSTNTITFLIDGNSQAITYTHQQTPTTFTNFSNPFVLGAKNIGGTVSQYCACTLDNVLLGTSSSNLYGKYSGISQTGTGTTLTDTSGKSNNGTLTGSPLPSWVAGFSSSAGFLSFFN